MSDTEAWVRIFEANRAVYSVNNKTVRDIAEHTNTVFETMKETIKKHNDDETRKSNEITDNL